MISYLKTRLSALTPSTSYSQAGGESLEHLKARNYNAQEGHLNERDGYNCPLCRNRGKTLELVERDGTEKAVFFECQCMHIRQTMQRMQRSGRADVIKKLTFNKFTVKNDFQKLLKESAQAYVKAGNGWFFVGGQSGCGKSHIGTAIFREFLLSGKPAQYMAWREDAARLKKLLGQDNMSYCEEMDKLKTTTVLYIDDLFKTGKTDGNQMQRPTSADINLAFEILNFRANHPELLTIISTECTMQQLIEIDEAIAGRIAENARPYVFSISPDRSKNYRLRDVVEL